MSTAPLFIGFHVPKLICSISIEHIQNDSWNQRNVQNLNSLKSFGREMRAKSVSISTFKTAKLQHFYYTCLYKALFQLIVG